METNLDAPAFCGVIVVGNHSSDNAVMNVALRLLRKCVFVPRGQDYLVAVTILRGIMMIYLNNSGVPIRALRHALNIRNFPWTNSGITRISFYLNSTAHSPLGFRH